MIHIDPTVLHKPTGYSHVVEVASGRTLYVSGQIALDPEGTLVGANDLHSQTRQVFENLRLALASRGAEFRHLAKLTVFLTDATQLPAFREARNEFLCAPLPACSLVQVARLARPDLLIEVEAIAVLEGADD